jgi:hypothetical protein
MHLTANSVELMTCPSCSDWIQIQIAWWIFRWRLQSSKWQLASRLEYWKDGNWKNEIDICGTKFCSLRICGWGRFPFWHEVKGMVDADRSVQSTGPVQYLCSKYDTYTLKKCWSCILQIIISLFRLPENTCKSLGNSNTCTINILSNRKIYNTLN